MPKALSLPLSLLKLGSTIERVHSVAIAMIAFRPDDCLILVADDLAQNLQVLGSLLDSAGYATTFATSGTQAIERAKTARPDLILLDLMMPGIDGLQTCAALKQEPQTCKIPIIFITASHDKDRVLDAFELGAVDYVTKPFESKELLARVKTHLELKRAKDELERALAEVERLAITDPLTGLFNRRYLYAIGEQEFERTCRYGAPFCVLMLDLDRFKTINDTYGHAVGDEVLRSTARCLRQTLRQSDVVGRFGGEEFLAILPSTPLAQAVTVAQRLRKAITRYSFSSCDRVTASFGVATYRPGDRSFESTVKRADDALYQAKREGRDRVCTCGDCAAILSFPPPIIAVENS